MQNIFEGKVWENVRQGLSDGLTGTRKQVFESVLEQTRTEMLKESASPGSTHSGNIASLNKVILPVLRRVMPNIIANEIIGVQPLQGPVAQINTLRFQYANTYAGVNAGTEALSPFDVAAAYSGNGDATNPSAAYTPSVEGTAGKSMSAQLVKQTAEAKARRISARWTIESVQDADSQFGMSLEDELLGALANEMTQEIDQEILFRLRKLARTGATFDMANDASFTGTPTFVGDRHAVLTTLINNEANKIAARTRRGRANWAVVDTEALTVMQSATTSAFARTTEAKFDDPDNQKLVGTLNNQVKVFLDTYAAPGTPLLLGYKGSESDAGAFYCPYVPLMASEIVTDPNTFEKVVSFVTRYAYVELDNSASSFGNSADYFSKISIPAGSVKFI